MLTNTASRLSWENEDKAPSVLLSSSEMLRAVSVSICHLASDSHSSISVYFVASLCPFFSQALSCISKCLTWNKFTILRKERCASVGFIYCKQRLPARVEEVFGWRRWELAAPNLRLCWTYSRWSAHFVSCCLEYGSNEWKNEIMDTNGRNELPPEGVWTLL